MTIRYIMFSVTNILIVCYSLKESLLFVPKFTSAGFSWGSAVRAVIAEVMYGHGWSATEYNITCKNWTMRQNATIATCTCFIYLTRFISASLLLTVINLFYGQRYEFCASFVWILFQTQYHGNISKHAWHGIYINLYIYWNYMNFRYRWVAWNLYKYIWKLYKLH